VQGTQLSAECRMRHLHASACLVFNGQRARRVERRAAAPPHSAMGRPPSAVASVQGHGLPCASATEIVNIIGFDDCKLVRC
jgi:hypothetical protein